jgi:hypothetical protein
MLFSCSQFLQFIYQHNEGKNVEEVNNTDGSIGTLKFPTLMVSLFNFFDLFYDVLGTSDFMSSKGCWMLDNNFERMSCARALRGGTGEKARKI